MGVDRMRLVKCGRFIVVLLIAIFCFSSVARAEERTAKEYMAEGIRAAYDNMHLVYQAYYDENGELEEQPAGHVAMWQEWDKDWNLISRTYLGPDGMPVNRIDGYARTEWKTDKNGTWYIEIYDVKGDAVPLYGINLARDVRVGEDGWSDWIAPVYDVENNCFNLGYAMLGKKKAGDSYTCSFEIEFRNVSATQIGEDKRFWFFAQGETDSQWGGTNIWNGGLINLYEPIKNGTKTCVAISTLNEGEVSVSRFNLGFCSDYWSSGEFRVRNVKVESGNIATEWTPGP